ncbi:MAG: response regulator, partial [Bacteroidales bacterium]|nr:response regulator [Bacteroidales bacterium]
AKEAIYLISQNSYALMIFDVQMPEIDGYELAEIIQSGYHNTKTPIMFISGVYFDEFSVFKGYRTGAVDYLTKPLNMEILQSKVKVFLELESMRHDLEEAKAKTQKALDDKTLFVAKVSHEIRNPLGVVMSVIDLFSDDGMSKEEFSEYVNIMKSSSKHMNRLLVDLVDYTRIEVGNVELDKAEFNLYEEIAGLIKAYEIKSKISKNYFSFSINDEIPQLIIGDVTRYKQIIYNLLENANKFTKEGNIKLTVDLVKSKEDFIFISTEVKDNGIGMTLAEQDELFKPFSQSNHSIHKNYGGSGLGLAIAKKLSVLMGGDIKLTSEKDKGSSFCFTAKFKF